MADVWRLAGTVLALATLAGAGLRFYLIGMAGVHAVSLVLVLYWLRDDRAVTGRALVLALVPPIVGTGAASVAALTVRAFVSPGGPSVAGAAVEAAVLAMTYALALRLAFPAAMEELVRELPERRRISRLLRFERAV
jgi:hypothetical protein